MRLVMTSMDHPEGHPALHNATSDWRASIYCLSHAGLIEVEKTLTVFQRRGRDLYRWTALAYLSAADVPQPRPEPEQLDLEDEIALAAMVL